jgi:hypothetical protein
MKTYFFLILLLLKPLSGQEQNKNRFKKPPPESGQLETAIQSIEYLEIPKKTLQAWYQKHPGKTILRSDAQIWLDRGEAGLIDHALMTAVAIPGKDIENNQDVIKEITHPHSFLPPRYEEEWPTPNSLDTVQSGNFWSLSFKDSKTGRAKKRVESHFIVHEGNHFHSALVEKTQQDGDVWTPVVHIYKRPGWHWLPLDTEGAVLAMQFDSLSHPEKAILLFIEGYRNNLGQIKRSSNLDDKALTVSAHYIQVPSVEWTSFSQTQHLKDLRLKTAGWANKLVMQKKAAILYSPSMMLRLGQEGAFEDLREHIYPTEYFRSQFPKRISRENALIPAAFDTKNVGSTITIEANQDLSGALIVRYRSYLITYHGKAAYHRFFDGEKWVADAWMPRFSKRGQSGTVALSLGENTLVGVSASIDDQGNPDPKNRLLFFLKAE